MRSMIALAVLLSGLAMAQPRPPGPPAGGPGAPPMPPQPPGPPPMAMMGGMHGGPGMHHPPGIPPAVAQKLGITPEVQKKVRDLGFDANDALIGLEADLKRAQLDLEKTMAGGAVEEAQVFPKLDAIAKAELAVRKNRLGLMLKIRKLLGPDTWEKLQAEMPMMGEGPGGGGTEIRREVRIMHGPGGPGGPGMMHEVETQTE